MGVEGQLGYWQRLKRTEGLARPANCRVVGRFWVAPSLALYFLPDKGKMVCFASNPMFETSERSVKIRPESRVEH